MSRFTKFALLSMAAFLVVGISIAANAKPPFLDKEQQITSAAVNAYGYSCTVVNVSDRTIDDVAGVVIDGETGTPLSSTFEPDLAPGIASGIGSSAIGQLAYCTITWTGSYGDLRATFCFSNSAGDTRACLDMY